MFDPLDKDVCSASGELTGEGLGAETKPLAAAEIILLSDLHILKGSSTDADSLPNNDSCSSCHVTLHISEFGSK